MSKLKEISRQSTTSWSPISAYPDYMAVGTVTGTIGVDFDTSSKLEIYSLDITNESKQMTLKGTTTSSTRFNKVVWGQASNNFPNGIIAGAMDNGYINLWDPSKIIGSDESADTSSSLIGVGQRHTGQVQSIDFNTQNPNLLASGGSDSEVFIWDLTDPTQPSAHNPGSKSQQSQDITCVAWNKKVPHILGSSSYNGYIVIWDLKSKKTLMTINDRNRKCKYRSIVWHPSEATQIVAASEDDDHPVIQAWDLRNTTSPIKSMEGHKKGVWGLSWCPSDNALLLSSGKDNKTFCWNYDRQEILCEINDNQQFLSSQSAAATNGGQGQQQQQTPTGGSDPNAWNFEVQWSPRVPALLSTSSYVGKVNVYSLQDVNEKNTTTPQVNALGLKETITPPTIKHTPNWLLRPCGAAFGFGGKIAVFGRPSKKSTGGATSPQSSSPQSSVQQGQQPSSSTSRIVHITHITTEKEIVKSSEQLENVINSGRYEEYCQEKIDQATTEDEKSIWSFLKVKFSKDDRLQILDYLGYDIEKIKKELSQFLGTLPELPIEKEIKQEQVVVEEEKKEEEKSTEEEQQDGDSFFDNVAAKSTTANEEQPSLVLASRPISPIQFPGDEKEQMITKALLVGDYSSAVECCLRLGRYSDALILAHSSGAELWKKTQEAYFEIVKSPFGRVVSCIVKRDFELLVKSSDLKDWKASLAILCTYSAPSDFKQLSGILGDRLENEAKDIKSAILCFICAGDIDKTVAIWNRQQQQPSLSSSSSSVSSPSLSESQSIENQESSNHELQNFIEKVSIFRMACGNNNQSLNEILSMKYAKYAEILASQGNLSSSLRYLAPINNPQACGVLFDRVYRSTNNHQGIPQPPFPFQFVDVYSSQQQQKQQQQKQHNHQHNQNCNHPPQPIVNNNTTTPFVPIQNQTPPPFNPMSSNIRNQQPPMMGGNINNQQPPMMMNHIQPPPPMMGGNINNQQQPPMMMSHIQPPPPMMGGNINNQPPPPPMGNINQQQPPMMMNQPPSMMGGNQFNQPPTSIAPPPMMGGNQFGQQQQTSPPPTMMGGNQFNQPPPSSIAPPPIMGMNNNQPPPMMGNMNVITPTAPPMMGGNQFNQPPPSSIAPPMMGNMNANSPMMGMNQSSPPPMMSTPTRSPPSSTTSSSSDFSAPAPKPNVHNKTPSILTGQLNPSTPEALPSNEDTERFVEKLNKSIQELNGKTDSKVWEDANKRCQTLINKVSKKDISGEAFRALDAILEKIIERDFKKASDTYIQITSTPLWAEVGSQSMVGLKRLIDLGLKSH